jgi:hypothetical protein
MQALFPCKPYFHASLISMQALFPCKPYFHASLISMEEVKDGRYPTMGATGSGHFFHLSDVVEEACLARMPDKIFVFWESISMSAWEVLERDVK